MVTDAEMAWWLQAGSFSTRLPFNVSQVAGWCLDKDFESWNE
jgi:hypothetical protein